MTKTLYYPVWISPGRKAGGWSWGRPCDSPREADQAVKVAMQAGAILGCVVQMERGAKTPMLSRINPPSARRVIEHWEDLWEATEPEKRL